MAFVKRNLVRDLDFAVSLCGTAAFVTLSGSDVTESDPRAGAELATESDIYTTESDMPAQVGSTTESDIATT